MLKLDQDEYMEAVAVMANALANAEDRGVKTFTARAGIMFEALIEVFDVYPPDPGPSDVDAMFERIRQYNRERFGAK
jgi:hypothetical protein